MLEDERKKINEILFKDVKGAYEFIYFIQSNYYIIGRNVFIKCEDHTILDKAGQYLSEVEKIRLKEYDLNEEDVKNAVELYRDLSKKCSKYVRSAENDCLISVDELYSRIEQLSSDDLSVLIKQRNYLHDVMNYDVKAFYRPHSDIINNWKN